MKIEGGDFYESFLSKHCFMGLSWSFVSLKQNVYGFGFAAVAFLSCSLNWFAYWHTVWRNLIGSWSKYAGIGWSSDVGRSRSRYSQSLLFFAIQFLGFLIYFDINIEYFFCVFVPHCRLISFQILIIHRKNHHFYLLVFRPYCWMVLLGLRWFLVPFCISGLLILFLR